MITATHKTIPRRRAILRAPLANKVSLRAAAGLLKDRYSDLKKHYRTIRKGWS